MADELGAELSLDLDAARREVEVVADRDLEDELEKAVSSFSDDYGKAVDDLPTIEPKIESDTVTEELTKAVQATDTELDFTTDGTLITNEINGAVESADAEVELTVDTTAVQAALDDLGGAEIGESIGAGFSDADLQAQELADTLGDLQEGGQETGDTLGNVSNVSTTLATAFSAAEGRRQPTPRDPQQTPGGRRRDRRRSSGTHRRIHRPVRRRSTQPPIRRTSQVVLGDAADRIEHINVGGLTGRRASRRSGRGRPAARRRAATNAAQMGLSAGKSASEVTHFANNVNALALAPSR